jgi:hypothetical protein
MTTLTTTTALAAAKDRLARLMATENIKVEHDPRAKTASFNVETRTLTMPVWKDMPEATGDMLIAHEVSHALHTPNGKDALIEACKRIDPRNPMVAKDYLNVTEDVRIERLMKARFPGTKTDFAKGYRWMKETDLFGLAKVGNLADLALIDRINIQYKIGWLVEVPFAADELALAQRAATTLTWEDAVELAKEIYEFAKAQNKSRPEPEKGDGGEPQEGDEEGDEGGAPTPTDADGDEEQEEKKTANTDADGDEDGDETEADEADGDDAEADADGDETEADETDADADGEETDADADGEETDADGDETDADADKPSTDEDGDADADGDETETETDETDNDESDNDEGQAPMARTLREVEDALLGRTDDAATVTHYADLPEVGKGFIVPRKRVAEDLKKVANLRTARTNKTVAEVAAEMMAAWRTENTSAVQVLATEFDRRKAADEHRRTAVAETGSIDPSRLWAYKISDEIFASNAYVKDGKNHGLMLLLDMSASMSGIIHDTVVQMVTLAAFCRRVNIPYRFYGFTDVASLDDLGETYKNTETKGERVRLLTLLEDGMSLTEFNTTAGLLLAVSYRMGSGSGNAATAAVGEKNGLCYALGNLQHTIPWANLIGHTPNNTALLGLSQVAQEFKATKRVQLVNMIVLTDGESTDNLCLTVTATKAYADKNYTEAPKIVVRDKKSGKEYTMTKREQQYYDRTKVLETPLNTETQTGVMAQLFRDRVGGKVVCIHLIDNGNAVQRILQNNAELRALEGKGYTAYIDRRKQLAKEVTAAWNEKGWWNLKGNDARGYDEYIMLPATRKSETVNLTADPTTGAGLRSLRNQFAKQLAATKGNRPLMTRVAELLAK